MKHAKHVGKGKRNLTSVQEEKCLSKGLQITYIIIFILFLCTAYTSWYFLQDRFEADTTDVENRNMAELPPLSMENLDGYTRSLESFINDHLPYRSSLIRMNSILEYSLYKDSPNPDVVIGKEDWLFYNTKINLSAYKGENLFNEKQLKKIAKNLQKSKDRLAKEGREFVLFIAPNRARMNARFMPDFIGPPAEELAVHQMIDYLSRHTDVKVVFDEDKLLDAQDQYPDKITYHKTDTHWNEYGAYICTVELLKTLGVQMPDYDSSDVTIEESDDVSGDMAKLMNLQDYYPAGKTYKVTGYDTHHMEVVESDFYGAVVTKAEGADPRSLFVIRDSFCTAMVDILGSQFQSARMVHHEGYKNAMIKEADPDIVVYECAEARIKDLKKWCYDPD